MELNSILIYLSPAIKKKKRESRQKASKGRKKNKHMMGGKIKQQIGKHILNYINSYTRCKWLNIIIKWQILSN